MISTSRFRFGEGFATGALLALASLSVLLLLGGCQPKTGGGSLELTEKYKQDQEEVPEEPYIPRDDGTPLSPTELKAFNSRGELDAKLSQEDAHIVELHFKFFVHERRRTFERYLERTARFLPHIKKVFTERGIPEEIAYLVMVESGGNPNAVSPVGAAGLWQFMPFTGKKYGLKQTTWMDERRDPFKATYAAADYLLKLYNDFSDWHLAVAAYNAGEGKIGRALGGTGASDFFELCRLDGDLDEKARLKDETRQYVPRLLAMAKIMRNLEVLGFVPPSPDDAWELETLEVPPGSNLAGLARHLGFTWEEFSGMNPAYRRTASPPTSISIAYVPEDKKEAAQIWLSSSEARIYADWREYTVKKRDTLSSISRQNGITVAALQQANNFTRLPRVGTVILIPGKSVAPVYEALSPRGSLGTYTVKQGDTLYALALEWGTDVDSIRAANRMGIKESKLSLGQRLSIPGNSRKVLAQQASEKSSNGPPRSSYVVRPGDTLFSIARSCGVSLQALCDANDLDKKKSVLKVGQTLRIPEKGGTAKVEAPQPRAADTPQVREVPGQVSVTVTVAKGDTLYAIALKHKTTVEAIRAANGLDEKSKLRIGQKLRIPHY